MNEFAQEREALRRAGYKRLHLQRNLETLFADQRWAALAETGGDPLVRGFAGYGTTIEEAIADLMARVAAASKSTDPPVKAPSKKRGRRRGGA